MSRQQNGGQEPGKSDAPRLTESLRRCQAGQWAEAHRQILRANTTEVVESLHDQRSALTSLMGFSGLIKLDPQSDQVSGWVENVLMAADRLRTLQSSLRSSVLLGEHTTGTMQAVEPLSLIRRLADKVDRQADELATVTVADEPPVESIEVFVAAQLLETVVFDLLLDGVTRGSKTQIRLQVEPNPAPVTSWDLTFEVTSDRAFEPTPAEEPAGSEQSADDVAASDYDVLDMTAQLAEHLPAKLVAIDTPTERRCTLTMTSLDARRADQQS